jgi:hypothetical protein
VFAFDDPSAVEPAVQLEPDSRPRWMDHLADMPVRPALGTKRAGGLADNIRIAIT